MNAHEDLPAQTRFLGQNQWDWWRGGLKRVVEVKKSSVVFIGLSVALLAGAAIVSNVLMRKDRSRSVMYFPSFGTDDVCTEVRYLPEDSGVDPLVQYVDELLLGPMTNRFEHLFGQGTKVEFCTVEKGVCYVGLSREALHPNKQTADIQAGIELLKVNIVKRFTEISTVLVYIDGRSVYGNG